MPPVTDPVRSAEVGFAACTAKMAAICAGVSAEMESGFGRMTKATMTDPARTEVTWICEAVTPVSAATRLSLKEAINWTRSALPSGIVAMSVESVACNATSSGRVATLVASDGFDCCAPPCPSVPTVTSTVPLSVCVPLVVKVHFSCVSPTKTRGSHFMMLFAPDPPSRTADLLPLAVPKFLPCKTECATSQRTKREHRGEEMGG